MQIGRSPRHHRMLYLSLGKPNAYIAQFLVNNPLIYEEHGQLKGLFFLDEGAIHSTRSIDVLKKKCVIPGLNDFSVLSFDNLQIQNLMSTM